MGRIADLATPPLRIAAAVTLGLGAATLLRCADRPAPLQQGTLEIHAKLRHQHAPLAAMAHTPAVIRPLLSEPADDDRALWVEIDVPGDSDPQAVLERLVADPEVDEAFVAPPVSLPNADDSCPITTPSFESYQGYLGPAPYGIDAPAAWRRGIRGQGVWFADIEGNWNAKHEDLPGNRITHAGGKLIPDNAWRAHGTAVLGEVVGVDNGKGVVGIAPDVERVFTSSIGGTSVANAIDTAQRALRPGDVLLIELQTGGPRGRWMPVEYWDDVYDVVHAATARGVIVIEAAGNGGENLDHPEYGGRLDRTKRDSGAIMVGAGGPPRDGFVDRKRLDFSNYGKRVDVQGWGRMVATLDYGDLQECDGVADRHYTGRFSGTSSASPIVAGAAVLVQSTARSRGFQLKPIEMRTLLNATGSPQVDRTDDNIGPRPNLARALVQLRD